MAAVKTDTATTLPEHPGFLSMAMTAIRLSVPWVQQPSAPCRSSEKIYTLEEVSWHDTPDDCWIVIYDRVYDITDFLYKHPGGCEVLLEHAGRDGTIAFRGWGHGEHALGYLQMHQVGRLPSHQCIYRTQYSIADIQLSD